jgi:hypothetical protein
VTQYSFARVEHALSRAAAAGTTEAAEALARELRANGDRALVETGKDGSAHVVVEGVAVVAREFGTKAASPRPVLGPTLQMSRTRIAETVSRKLAGALKGGQP